MWRTLGRIRYAITSRPNAQAPITKSSFTEKQTALRSIPTIYTNSVDCSCSHRFKEKQRHDHRARHKGPFENVSSNWMEAFGWSGIIFLSWVLCFPCHRRRYSRLSGDQCLYYKLPVFTTECSTLVKNLSSLILQPTVRSVLPTVSAVKSKGDSSSGQDENDVLRKTCENLDIAHAKVMSGLNNWLGTESMQAGKHSEAFNYFSAAADADNAAGLFNLGICYEMGLGTSQSFPMAAKLYRKASDLGHATAMYNLGVFHVHGWGGMEANGSIAHELFEAAAKLGQTDAMKALNWEESASSDLDPTPPPSPVETTPPNDLFCRDIIEPKDNDLTDLWFKVLNIKLNDVYMDGDCIKGEDLESSDSGINVLPTLISSQQNS